MSRPCAIKASTKTDGTTPSTPVPHVTPTQPSNRLPELSKMFAAMLAFVYVVGFLVSNGHSAQYAVVSPELLQAKYLSAGLLFVVVAAFPTGIAAFQYLVRKRKLATEDTTKVWWKRVEGWTFWFTVPFSLLQALVALVWSESLLGTILVDRSRPSEMAFFVIASLLGLPLASTVKG